MATFPNPNTNPSAPYPAYGVTKTSQPNIRTTQFGDGYQARIRFGMNQNPKVYRLTFNVSETESDVIENFLDARASDTTGTDSCFTWTPPGESSSGKYICPSWTKTIPYLNRAIIRATFQEVFEA